MAQTTYYWDVDGALPGFGTDLTGDWNASAFWSTSPDGTSATTITWPNTAGDDVVFSAVDALASGTINVQNVKNGSSVNSITTKVADQTVTLQGQTSGRVITMSGAGIINVEDGAAAIDLTLNVDIAGTNGFNKTGAGMIYKTSVDSYTGTTRISEGTLLAGNNAIPDDSAVVVESGATLSYADGGGRTDVVGSLAGAGNLLLKGIPAVAAFTAGGDNSSTEFSGVISSANAAGWFVKTGTGTLTLSGDNTFRQEMHVSTGVLLINGDQSVATGDVTAASGATLGGSGVIGGVTTVNGNLESQGTLTFKDGLVLAAGSTNIIEIPATGYDVLQGGYSNVLTMQGEVIFDFSGNNVINETIFSVLPSWGLISTNGATFTAVNLGTDQKLDLSNLTSDGTIKVVASVFVPPATLYWDANGAAAGFGTDLTGDWNTNAFWSTAEDGTAVPGSWLVTPGNDVVFSAMDCTVLSTVTVQNVLSDSAVNTITTKAAAQAVRLSGQTSGRVLTMSGDAIINVEDGAAANDLELYVDIAGSAGLHKTGAGTIYKKSVDSYSGTTRISEGTLLAGHNAIPDDSAVVIESGATLSYADGGGRMDVVGSLAGAGNLILKGAPAVAAFTSGGDNSSTEFSGVISSADADGWFVKTGTGTLTLSGDNTFRQEIHVDAGGLLIDGDQSAATGSVIVVSDARLGGSGTVGADIHFAGGGRFLFVPGAGPLTVTAGGTVTFSDFDMEDVSGLSTNLASDTYTLINGTVDLTNVGNVGANNACYLGEELWAYFEDTDGLQVKIFWEDRKSRVLNEGTFSGHVYSPIPGLDNKLSLEWDRADYVNAYMQSPLLSDVQAALSKKQSAGSALGRFNWNDVQALASVYSETGSTNAVYAGLICDCLLHEAAYPSSDIQFSLCIMAYCYRQVQSGLSSGDQSTIEEMLADHADDAVGLESGTAMNRGILNTLGLLRVCNLLPVHPNHSVWTAKWTDNWSNDFLRIKDNNEDAIHYNQLWLYAMMQMVDELGIDQQTFYSQPWVEEIFERHLNVRMPTGTEPETIYGVLRAREMATAVLEWAGKIYQDGRYRWAAHREMNFFRAQAGYSNEMPRTMLLLPTDDSVIPVAPSIESFYSERRYDREFPNKLALRSGYGTNASFLAMNLFNVGGHGLADGSAIYCLMDQYGLLLSGGHRYSSDEQFSNLLLLRPAGINFPFGNPWRPDIWHRTHVNLRAGSTATGMLNIDIGSIKAIGLRVEAEVSASEKMRLGTIQATGTNGTLTLNSEEKVFDGDTTFQTVNFTARDLEPFDGLDIWWKYDDGVRLNDVQALVNSENPQATSRWAAGLNNWRDSRVRAFGDTEKVHFASVEVDVFAPDGNDHRQYRDIIMLPNELFWVRDTMIWGSDTAYQAAPLWHVAELLDQGPSWFQTATPTIFRYSDIWTHAGEERQLLIAFPPRAGMQPELVSSTYAPGGRPYTVFQKWEGTTVAGGQTAFNSLLIPNNSSSPATLAAQADLRYEDDHAAVLQYGNWLLVDNPDGLTVEVDGLQTDYKLLAIELDGTNAGYAAGMGGDLCEYDGNPLEVATPGAISLSNFMPVSNNLMSLEFSTYAPKTFAVETTSNLVSGIWWNAACSTNNEGPFVTGDVVVTSGTIYLPATNAVGFFRANAY